jgi:hypothetical protein
VSDPVVEWWMRSFVNFVVGLPIMLTHAPSMDFFTHDSRNDKMQSMNS